jgi:hypothetical protein
LMAGWRKALAAGARQRIRQPVALAAGEFSGSWPSRAAIVEFGTVETVLVDYERSPQFLAKVGEPVHKPAPRSMVARVSTDNSGQISMSLTKSGSTGAGPFLGVPDFVPRVWEIGVFEVARAVCSNPAPPTTSRVGKSGHRRGFHSDPCSPAHGRLHREQLGRPTQCLSGANQTGPTDVPLSAEPGPHNRSATERRVSTWSSRCLAHDVLQGLDGRPGVGKVLGEALTQNVQRQPAVRDVVVRQARNNGRRNSADSILNSGGD